MFEAKVYTTAILSLSGMMDEIHTARETVSRFNQQHAASTGRLFLPVDDPQAADVVIGIVGNYIEKADVIEEAVKAGKQVLLFFSKYQDPKNTIPMEGKAVETFKKEMGAKCVCCEFSVKADFEASLAKALAVIEINMNK